MADTNPPLAQAAAASFAANFQPISANLGVSENGVLPSIVAAASGSEVLQKQSSLSNYLDSEMNGDKDNGPPLTPVLGPGIPFSEPHASSPSSSEVPPSLPTGGSENTPGSLNPVRSLGTPRAAEKLKSSSRIDTMGAQATNLSPLESWKNWGMQKLKVARRAIAEKLGNAAPSSVDKELEEKVQRLQSIQTAYKQLIKLAKTLVSHLCGMVNAQKQLQSFFNEMAVHNIDLSRELAMNAETQKTLHKNGLALIAALTCFLEGMNTLTFKTIADTLSTWDALVAARLEFDTDAAERKGPTAPAPAPAPASSATSNPWAGTASSPSPLTPASALSSPAPGGSVPATPATELPSERRYRDLCATLHTKLALLDENRIQVMKKQLALFHSATCAFFSGNHAALEKLLADLHLMAVKADQVPAPSWLEQLQESAATTLGSL